jgi:uncharacterized protein
MRSWLILLLAACGEDAPEEASHALVSTTMVVSQIYGGGGNPGADWHNDYVELFNRGSGPVDMNGWSLQYGSSTSNLNLQVNITGSTIVPAGRYFLISLGSSGSHGVTVPADLVGTGAGAFNISNADGKVAIVSNQTPLGCGGSTRCTSAAIVDLAGYGQGTDYETAAAVSPSGVGVNGAIYRAGNGCIDTDDNSADFFGAGAVPRNASTPLWSCNVDLAGIDLTSLPDLTPEADLAGGDLAGALPAVGGPVVISQFYGAGGDSGAVWRNDYVELFNRSDVDAGVGGWSLQYASKDNTFALKVDIPGGTVIPAGGYFLIRLSSGGGSGATVADPDLLVVSPAVLNISAASGKLALVDTGTLQVCGTAANRCASPAIVDLVGYGAASDYEGAPSGSFASVGDGLFRKLDGCQDTDHNDQDFASAAALPRNSGTPVHPCAVFGDAGTGPADAATVDDAAIPFDDAAVPDAGPADAAAPRDLGFVLHGDDLGVPGDDLAVPISVKTRAATGCGCEVGGAGEGGWWFLLLLLAVAARRSRATVTSPR